MIRWLKFLLMAFLLILYILGEWLIALLLVTTSLPVVIWSHLKIFYREKFGV